MCIDGIKPGEESLFGALADGSTAVYEGGAYTVTGTHSEYDINWYTLAEKPSDSYYDQDLFIPLSEIDELQIKKPEPCQY